jgi:hypothetical protein
MPSTATTDDLIELLVPVWTEVLGVAATPDSDFLALGGNSLSAVTIANAVAERYSACPGIEAIALQATFEAPTLRAMADLVTAVLNEPASA